MNSGTGIGTREQNLLAEILQHCDSILQTLSTCSNGSKAVGGGARCHPTRGRQRWQQQRHVEGADLITHSGGSSQLHRDWTGTLLEALGREREPGSGT
jgi:hypothetical protein